MTTGVSGVKFSVLSAGFIVFIIMKDANVKTNPKTAPFILSVASLWASTLGFIKPMAPTVKDTRDKIPAMPISHVKINET